MATAELDITNYEQLISLSEKLNGEIKTIGQDVINLIRNKMMNRDTSTCFLLKVVNRIVGDTFNVISDLQEIVIRSTEEKREHTVSELFEKSTFHLKDIVQKLSRYCNEMVKEYNSFFSTLKQKFLLFVENIIIEAECLLNIIKIDDFHDFRDQLVKNLNKIWFTIHITQARIQIKDYTQKEINDAKADMLKNFRNDIVKIETCSLEVLKNLFFHIRHIAEHNQIAVCYLQKAVINFDDAQIQHEILESTKYMIMGATSFIIDSERCNIIKEIIATVESASIYYNFKKLLLFIHRHLRRNGYKKIPEHFTDLATYFFVHCFVVKKQIGNIFNMIDYDH